MPKVYCSECRHYSVSDMAGCCDVVNVERGNWLNKLVMHYVPDLQNEDNDCPHWQHIRSFGERFNDFFRGYFHG